MKHERDDDVRGPLPKRQCHLTPASWAATDNNATDMPGGGPRSGQGGIEMAVVPRAGSTPSRKLALTDAGDEHSGEVAPSGISPSSQTSPADGRVSPDKPEKMSPSRQKAQAKRACQAKWDQYCREKRWVKDTDYIQVGRVYHKTDAKARFALTDVDLETLPHVQFENEKNLNHPGRSYEARDLIELASRKRAVLGGVIANSERELIRQGRELFLQHQDARERKHPGVTTRRKFSVYGFEYDPDTDMYCQFDSYEGCLSHVRCAMS